MAEFIVIGKQKVYRNKRNDQLTLVLSRRKLNEVFPMGHVPKELLVAVPKSLLGKYKGKV